ALTVVSQKRQPSLRNDARFDTPIPPKEGDTPSRRSYVVLKTLIEIRSVSSEPRKPAISDYCWPEAQKAPEEHLRLELRRLLVPLELRRLAAALHAPDLQARHRDPRRGRHLHVRQQHRFPT